MLLHIIKKKINNNQKKEKKIVNYNLVFDGSSYIDFQGNEYFYRDFQSFLGINVFFRSKEGNIGTFFIPSNKFSILEFEKLKKDGEKEKLLYFE